MTSGWNDLMAARRSSSVGLVVLVLWCRRTGGRGRGRGGLKRSGRNERCGAEDARRRWRSVLVSACVCLCWDSARVGCELMRVVGLCWKGRQRKEGRSEGGGHDGRQEDPHSKETRQDKTKHPKQHVQYTTHREHARVAFSHHHHNRKHCLAYLP
jgi:hypothetical protein